MITASEIRQRYVDFFLSKGHTHAPSAPLVPPDDPTLLFTTAGMVQFKRLYSGDVPLPYRRAVTVQKCLRAGGKGSDLENVGRTLRHHTFFEMLGNFSFGDYFKQEAISWAWEFCTGEPWLALPPERIWATIFGKPTPDGWTVDTEAEGFWINETGIKNPVIRLDEKENFWGPAGETGACGPCSEIKFFMGSDEELRQYQELARSGDEGLRRVAHDIVEKGDLFLEIWNLVFPQYDQQPGGARPPLKNRGIDTGAGLERVTTACQRMASGGKVWSPYETDLLSPIIDAVAAEAKLPYPRLAGGEDAAAILRQKGHDSEVVRMAMNACADHARTLCFALAEGIVPSNEGRGYVIRRILRRAARFGKKIGISDPFLWKLVKPVIDVMGDVYPELMRHPDQIEKTIRLEEERFSRTLHLGSEMLEGMLKEIAAGGRLRGEDAYRLYDTYGFPLDLAIEAAEERGLGVDTEGFDKCLAEGKARARASWKGGAGLDLGSFIQDLRTAGNKCEFVGYQELSAQGRVLAIVRDGKRVPTLEEGQAGIVVLDRTPFYGEGGGQIGDAGMLRNPDGLDAFEVEDAQKTDDGFVFHFGEARSRIEAGQEVVAAVDGARRGATIRHHSATHLLQGALKRLIGSHVTQAGSYVGPDRLRFDFTNPEAVPAAKLHEIETVVNEQIQRNLLLDTRVMGLEEARATGAIAPFGEKYGAVVRVVKMGDFSTEFCGGTHVGATGEIGPFIITGESSVASGVRRIEAQTGLAAARTIARERGVLAELSRALTVTPEALPERVAALQAEIKSLKRAAEKAKTEQIAGKSSDLAVVRIGEIDVCVAWIDGLEVEGLRGAFDTLKSKHKNQKFIALLGSGGDGRATLIAGATPDLAGTAFEAGKLIREFAPLFDARGGGKAQFAQAGGKDAEKLKAALEGTTVLERLRTLA